MTTKKLLAAFAGVALLSAAIALPTAQADDEKPKQKVQQDQKVKNPEAEKFKTRKRPR
jgi:hypothetical protein